jgi:hypothetical protein
LISVTKLQTIIAYMQENKRKKLKVES